MKIFFKILFWLCIIPILVFFLGWMNNAWYDLPDEDIAENIFQLTGETSTTPETTTPEITTPEETTPEETIPAEPSFAYTVNTDGETCTITGIGTHTESDLVIGTHIDGYKITAIDNKAFENCSNLTSVTISDSVISIGYSAFRSCSNLTSVTIGSSVTAIGNSAFWGCSGLTNVTIPKSVKAIGSYTFYNCSGLTKVTFGGTVEQWNSIEKGSGWNYNTGEYTVRCTDGTITKG